MEILILEPFFSGSHRVWAERIRDFSKHRCRILSLEGRYWKWRMRGGAVLLAREYLRKAYSPELILSSSLIDLPVFIGMLAKEGAPIPPLVQYCHENQFLYPTPGKSPFYKEQRNNFGAVDWRSALIADRLFYNSRFHRREALKAYENFLRSAPDHGELEMLEGLKEKASIYPPAPELEPFDRIDPDPAEKGERMELLWNHRWEPEKGPEEFTRITHQLMERHPELRLILLGSGGSAEGCRQELRQSWPQRISFAGEAPDEASYRYWVKRADLTLVSSYQDFFGLSVIEAMYCGVIPLLPDRLAYPEHLPPELKELLYREPDEAREKAERIIEGEWKPPRERIHRAAALYDIRCWIGEFDEELEALATERLR